jgi:hypothetical protein
VVQLLEAERDELFSKSQTASGSNLASYSSGMSPGVKQPGREADHSLHPEPKLKMSGAVSLLAPHSFTVYTGTTLPLP